MDWLTSVVIPGVTAIVVAVGTSWWVTRRAEIRTGARDHALRRLRDTRTSVLANLDYLLRRRVRRETAAPIDFPGNLDAPFEDVTLIGDQGVLDRVTLWMYRVGFVVDGSAFTEQDFDEYQVVKDEALRALDAQVERALRYQKLLTEADLSLSQKRAMFWLADHPDGHVRQSAADG